MFGKDTKNFQQKVGFRIHFSQNLEILAYKTENYYLKNTEVNKRMHTCKIYCILFHFTRKNMIMRIFMRF